MDRNSRRMILNAREAAEERRRKLKEYDALKAELSQHNKAQKAALDRFALMVMRPDGDQPESIEEVATILLQRIDKIAAEDMSLRHEIDALKKTLEELKETARRDRDDKLVLIAVALSGEKLAKAVFSENRMYSDLKKLAQAVLDSWVTSEPLKVQGEILAENDALKEQLNALKEENAKLRQEIYGILKMWGES